MKKKIAILIPVYNVGKNINFIVEKLDKMNFINKIVVVDDGSTHNVILEGNKVRLLRHEFNKGKGAALKTGFNFILNNIDVNAILTMDGDGQHSVDDVEPMVRFYYSNENIGILVGARKRDKTMPLSRKFTNFISAYFATKITKQHILDCQSGFRIYNANLLRDIKMEADSYDLENEILLKAGLKNYIIKNYPIKTIYTGDENSSHYKKISDSYKITKLFMKYYFFRKRMIKNVYFVDQR